jgi:hypothetical protein
MRHAPRAVAASALLTLAAVTACRDAVAPRQDLDGAYRLRAVGGQPVPAVLWVEASAERGRESLTLLDASYRFERGGAVRYVGTLRHVRETPARDTVLAFDAPLAYRRLGARVEITPRTPCPPNALCADHVFVGTLAGGVLEGDVGGPPGQAVRYRYELAP